MSPGDVPRWMQCPPIGAGRKPAIRMEVCVCESWRSGNLSRGGGIRRDNRAAGRERRVLPIRRPRGCPLKTPRPAEQAPSVTRRSNWRHAACGDPHALPVPRETAEEQVPPAARPGWAVPAALGGTAAGFEPPAPPVVVPAKERTTDATRGIRLARSRGGASSGRLPIARAHRRRPAVRVPMRWTRLRTGCAACCRARPTAGECSCSGEGEGEGEGEGGANVGRMKRARHVPAGTGDRPPVAASRHGPWMARQPG